ncbi:MAG: redox-sensing transcriptional repressor Rex [Spirochaetales bacterium]|nr:redox-sensing transcriptional repressor Rex [Spirochaetales bacterium]
MKNFTDRANLPLPALERLARVYTLLGRLREGGVCRVSSGTLGELLGVPAHTVRKDLSLLGLGLSGRGPGGYDAEVLLGALGERLGLGRMVPVCLAGIGRLGGAILHRMEGEARYPLAAAFDASMNRIELTRTAVPLYHSSHIRRVVREKGIRIGIIAVPACAALDVAERLISGGVRGIVNFTSVVIPAGFSARHGTAGPVMVRNVSLTGELDVICAYFNTEGVLEE